MKERHLFIHVNDDFVRLTPSNRQLFIQKTTSRSVALEWSLKWPRSRTRGSARFLRSRGFDASVGTHLSARGVSLARWRLCPSCQSKSAVCAVTRLSQTTTVPFSHFTRAWKSAPRATWSNRNFSRKSDSSWRIVSQIQREILYTSTTYLLEPYYSFGELSVDEQRLLASYWVRSDDRMYVRDWITSD